MEERISKLPAYIRETIPAESWKELTEEEIDILSDLSEEEFEEFRERFSQKDESEE
jgi:hypothetical protein